MSPRPEPVPTPPAGGTAPGPADRQRSRLRRMKGTAVLLLALAAGVYVAAVLAGPGPGRGYLRAGAEAALVGGLADWFAVTALFRHPLGLPIPHTALIPTRKDAFAASLGEFITANFLTPDVLRVRLADARLVPRLGGWLAGGESAEAVSRESAIALAAVLDAVSGDEATEALLAFARRDLADRSYGPALGRLLAEVVRTGGHRPLVDLIVSRTRVWLAANREVLVPYLRRTIEPGYALGWLLVGDKRVGRVIDTAEALAAAVEADPDHELRRTIDRLLADLADGLEHNLVIGFRLDRELHRLLDRPASRQWLQELIEGSLLAVRRALLTPGSDLARRVTAALQHLGARAVADPAFQARLANWLERGLLHVVTHYAGEFTRLIEDTVARWDPRSTARRIELAVGRDLQFIRVNGTVVGALAGLAIHAVGRLLG